MQGQVVVLSNHQEKQKRVSRNNKKEDEGNTMNNTVNEVKKNGTNGKEKVLKADNKVCAILNTITAFIWAIVTVMDVRDIIFYGHKAGWDLWFDISMIIVWGSIAVDYFIKYKKEQQAQ